MTSLQELHSVEWEDECEWFGNVVEGIIVPYFKGD